MDTNAKFTPGPWDTMKAGKLLVCSRRDRPGFTIPEGVLIAEISPEQGRETANAALIASAPELLDAARDIEANWDKWDGKIDGASVREFAVAMAATMQFVRAAIAKAEGR